MHGKYSIAVLFMFLVAVIGFANAQESVTEIPPCSTNDLKDLRSTIDVYLPDIVTAVYQEEERTAIETFDFIASQQRGYSNGLRVLTLCLETYTIGFVLGLAIDHYSIGYGLLASADYERASGNREAADDLQENAERHITQAEGILENRLPEIYEFYVDGAP